MRRDWMIAALIGQLALACTRDEPPAAHLSGRGESQDEQRAAPARTTEEIRRDGNHLLDEPSPYLQQHAHNPVDWYPWGPEALARARDENKPIFLSIGYSTCHWCHVMEEESFEDDEVARYLNEHFVSIKVDREQRPDVDALYMHAVSEMGGSTGWPLTVFLTPDLVPFFGGTYFPRHGGMGRPGFMDVLGQVRERFETQGDAVAAQGRRIFERIEAEARRASGGSAPPSSSLIAGAMRQLERARDRQLGGFGMRQKFPNSPLLLAELRYVERTGDDAVRAHLVTTLEQAMRGGIHDHLAGTFHRYAVDRRWHVPHFEKMLYDNAQLAQVYVEAGRAFDRPDFVGVGRGILDDLIAHWQTDEGGFVVGFDADDPGGEGFYYSWTPAELEAVLGEDDAARFATLFGVTERGEHELGGRSVLHRIDDGAARSQLSMEPAEVDAFVDRVRPRLLAARRRRAPPATDDKVLAAWNGLAIMALANVGRWLEEPRYVAAAQQAARFVAERLWDDGVMLRGRRRGESLGEGFLDDHALVALGLLRLHAADGDPRWLILADEIGSAMIERYFDEGTARFLHTARADTPEQLPLRRPDLDDGVLPSGGTAATLLALELGALSGDRALHHAGERAIAAAAPQAVQRPFRSGFLLVALDHAVGEAREVVIAGDRGDPRTAALWSIVRPTVPSRVLPARLHGDGAGDALARRYPALEAKGAIDDAPTAYVCRIGSCELPTGDPAELRRQLAEAGAIPSR